MRRINTISLFPELNNYLIDLLENLSLEEWMLQSPIKGRTVKDIVSHILDGTLRRLSIQRDGFEDRSRNIEIKNYHDLTNHIQELNKNWIHASRRLSPKILIELLRYSENELLEFFKTLPLDDEALFPVAWAGESQSPNWFDIAREFTEKWHHQMQIRLTLKRTLLMDEKYLEPLYDTFMLGLPFALRETSKYIEGETIKVSIHGELNKSWYLKKTKHKWKFEEKLTLPYKSELVIPAGIGWIIFTNTDRNKAKYRKEMEVQGETEILDKVTEFVTVMS